jgi:hypothetical protein
MEITRRAGRRTVNMAISTMKKIQSIKSVDILVFTHGIARLVTRGGRKSALRVDVKKRD